MKKLSVFIILSAIIIAVYLFHGINPNLWQYFLKLRIIKILGIILVSIAIAYSTNSFQTITNTNILTPNIMGIDALYLFIQTVIVFILGDKSHQYISDNNLFFISIILMILLSLVLFFFLFKGENKNIYFLVLTGIVVGSFLNSMANFMQVLLDPNEFDIIQGKMFASFSKVNSDLLLVSIIIITISFSLVIIRHRNLDLLALGRNISINLGLNFHKEIMIHWIATVVMVAVSTALVGPLSFLGLIIVSITKQYTKSNSHLFNIFTSIFISIFALTLTIFLLERLFNNITTISVIINFLGGIYFVYLLLKERK